jgi:hypothetical protein
VSKIVRVVSNESANGAAEGFARSKALSLLNSGAKNISQVLYLNSARIEINVRGGQAYVRIFDDEDLWIHITRVSPALVSNPAENIRYYSGKTATALKKKNSRAVKQAIEYYIQQASIYGSNALFDTRLITDGGGRALKVLEVRANTLADGITIVQVGKVIYSLNWVNFVPSWGPRRLGFLKDGTLGPSTKSGVFEIFGGQIVGQTGFFISSRVLYIEDNFLVDDFYRGAPITSMFNPFNDGDPLPLSQSRFRPLIPATVSENTVSGGIIYSDSLDSTSPPIIGRFKFFGDFTPVGPITELRPSNARVGSTKVIYIYAGVRTVYVGGGVHIVRMFRQDYFLVYDDGDLRLYRRDSTEIILAISIQSLNVLSKIELPQVFDPSVIISSSFGIFGRFISYTDVEFAVLGPGIVLVYDIMPREGARIPPYIISNSGQSYTAIPELAPQGDFKVEVDVWKLIDLSTPLEPARLYVHVIDRASLIATSYEGEYSIIGGSLDLKPVELDSDPFDGDPVTPRYLGKATDKSYTEQLDSLGS